MKVERFNNPRIVIEIDESTASKVLGLLHLASWEKHLDLEELAMSLADAAVEENPVFTVNNEIIDIFFDSDEQEE